MEPFSGSFEMIDPKQIVVDHRYQRPEKEGLILDIAQTFSWPSFGTITCYRRNNMYYAVDGQQRLQAAMTLNPQPKKVPCIVFPEAALKQEARTFVDMQVNRKAVSGLEKHKAEIVAEHPPALAIERAAAKVGFTIGDTSASKSKTISSIATMHWIYDNLGEEGIVQVLTQARDAWPDDDYRVNQHMLRGIANVIIEQAEKYDRASLTKALSKSYPERLIQQAKAFQFQMGGSMEVNVRRAIKHLCKV